MAEISESAARQVLDGVIDPATGKSVVASGMVSGIATRGGHVAVTLEVDPARGPALEPLRQLTNLQEYAVDQFDNAATDTRIVLSWVATTQSITPEMQAVQARVEASPAPTAHVAPTGINLSQINPALLYRVLSADR